MDNNIVDERLAEIYEIARKCVKDKTKPDVDFDVVLRRIEWLADLAIAERMVEIDGSE